jgi:heme iron utilization protein
VAEEEDLRRAEAAQLLKGQKIAVLASSNHGHPYSSMVAFTATEDLKTIVFFIRRDSQTYRNLKSDGRACLFTDSREKLDAGYEEVEGLRITGVAWEIKNEQEYKKLKKIHLEKHPGMAAFVEDANTAQFKLTVSSYRFVFRFNEAFDFDP